MKTTLASLSLTPEYSESTPTSTPTSTSACTTHAFALTSLSISKLNNQDLESELKKLVLNERKLLHLILLHIKEVDSRKLYLKKAYPSLFEYLVKEHGYSPAGAMRRIDAARLLRDVPQMAQKIQTGQINLSQITEISRAIKEKQKKLRTELQTELQKELRTELPLDNKRQASAFISRQEKENLVLKVAGLSLAETQKVVSLELDIKPKEFEKKRTQKDESVRLELTLTKEQMTKLNKCKDLTAHIMEQKKMDSSLASVIEVLMDQFLKKHDSRTHDLGKRDKVLDKLEDKSERKPNLKPKNKSENESTCELGSKQSSIISDLEVEQDTLEALESKALALKARGSKVQEPQELKAQKSKAPAPKALSTKTRDLIHRQNQCCQYRDPLTNRKCGSTFKLEVDHKRSRWANGDHEVGNLQTLCKNHNNFKYQVEAGFL